MTLGWTSGFRRFERLWCSLLQGRSVLFFELLDTGLVDTMIFLKRRACFAQRRGVTFRKTWCGSSTTMRTFFFFFFFLFFFFFFQALNFLQLKVLAFSTTSLHFPPSWTQASLFFIFIWQMSCLMLSSHLYLGLACDLLVRGFELTLRRLMSYIYIYIWSTHS